MINLLAAKGSIIFQINRCVEIFDVEPAVRNAFCTAHKTLSESISVSPFFSLTGPDLHVSLIGWCRFKMETLLPADWLGAEGGRQCV